VPAALRSYAGLDRDCVVIGANTRLEIWDAQGMGNLPGRPGGLVSLKPLRRCYQGFSDRSPGAPGRPSAVQRVGKPHPGQRPGATSPVPGKSQLPPGRPQVTTRARAPGPAGQRTGTARTEATKATAASRAA